jgi:CelD/BcsL family acetyltransferase involved in cellulose biosynthesis
MNANGVHLPAAAEMSAAAAVVDRCDPAVWVNLASHPSASLFTSKPWMEAVAASYGFTIATSAHFTNGNATAALIFSRISDLRGERIISFPFSDFCDPLVSDIEDWRKLIAPLLAQGVPVNFRCLRSEIVAGDNRFRPVGRLAWHGTDLTRSTDAIWAGLAAPARGSIRRARHRQLAIREGKTLDDVRKFYDMHCHVRKSKYRLLAQPFAFFEQLYTAFAPDRLTVLLAEDQGVTVAGTFFIEWADTLYYKFNASVDQGAAPNDLMIWEAIRLGQRRGLKLLDFGASDLDQPGLLRFKRKYATEERAIVRYRWEPPEYDPVLSRSANHVLNGMTELLTDPTVPDAITRTAGERLYGLFS